MEKIKYIILSPLSYMWETIYRIRRLMYDYNILKKSYFKVPIISVGNLTFGGTGKTPFTIWLADYLNNKRLKPLILTRGYKGKFENESGIIYCGGIFRVNPREYGDEPALMDRKLKNATIVVGKNRSQNLKFYFNKVQADVVILDDGFQHLKLNRDFNIVLFDGSLPIKKYKTAPNGYLREGMTALKDADAVVVNAQPWLSEDSIVELENFIRRYCDDKIPLSRIVYKPLGLMDGHYQMINSVEQLQGIKAIVVAGLASPGSFQLYIESFGVEVIKFHSFPDHYDFTMDDIEDLLTEATQVGAVIITTEKDIVKIRRISTDSRILFLDIDVEFSKNEEGFFSALNTKVLRDKSFSTGVKSSARLQLVGSENMEMR